MMKKSKMGPPQYEVPYQNPLRKRFSADFFKKISQEPGVYFMLNAKQEILYIGKAKNLKNRILSYTQAKPGLVKNRILRMLDRVSAIQWTPCPSEENALRREYELIQAVRPPFNVAHKEDAHYLFIGLRESNLIRKKAPKPGFMWIDFQLSSREEIHKEGYQLFGCFKHRGRTKRGYTALMRLLYAATVQSQRFSFPGRISRPYPPWLYFTTIPQDYFSLLTHFLSGMKLDLLHILIEKMLENESIPAFMRPNIQMDIDNVLHFYDLGPKSNYEIRNKFNVLDAYISHSKMDELILADFRSITET